MHLVSAPYATDANLRPMPFPAPLCEACNIPMALNGEYCAIAEGPSRREHQCRMCGSAMLVRRSRAVNWRQAVARRAL